jgi:type II secretory pathway pseudopilin PulG
MKKWYQYWTIWAAIASMLACWMIMWITGDQEPGTIASTLATAALAFFVAFFVQRSRAKKAAAAAKTQQVAQAAAKTQQTASPAAQTQRTEAAGAQAPSGPRAAFERHKVAGTTYHLDAIMELAEDNPDYDMTQREIIDAGMEEERIYQYTFPDSPVELVDDPDNEQDPNAIKVLVAGQHIGYIKRGSTGRIHKLQRSGRVLGITAEIYGGRYKVVRSVEEYQTQHYEMDRDESNYGAAIELRIQPEPEQEPVSTLDT